MNTARIHQRYLLCKSVSTDTRTIKEGCMFFALRGLNYDGNLFAAEALRNGARYVVVDDKNIAKDHESYILVKDSLEALQHLALFHRTYLDVPILAITGSNGKTTTKELICAVLSRKLKVVATDGNFNNHIGVPLTLLSMDESTEMGVVEMGANHPGEINFLCTIANPDYGYITNFGKAHLEGFGNLEGVIKSKTELYRHLEDNKKMIFLNLDDEVQQRHRKYAHTFAFGEGREADVQMEYTESGEYAEVFYNQTHFVSQLTGSYNALNIAATLCIGLYFKVDFFEIENAIANYSPNNNRSQILKHESNSIILDAYNANPTSMTAAVQNFKKLKTDKQKIAILGDMYELGESSANEHQAIVDLFVNDDIKEIYLLGDNFNATQFSNNLIFKFKTIEDLKMHLEETNFKNCYFLIKGSRAMALERILESINKDYITE